MTSDGLGGDGPLDPGVEPRSHAAPGADDGATDRRRRAFVIAAVAACVALVVAAAVVVATRGPDEVDVVAASPAELLASLQGADPGQSFAYELERSATGSGGSECAGSTSQRGRVDPSSGVATIDLDGGQLTFSASGAGTVTAALAPPAWGVETPLLGFTIDEVVRAQFALDSSSPLAGVSSDPFDSTGSGFDMAERFAELRDAASSVEVVGTEPVRGTDTTHVVVQLDDGELAAIRARTGADDAAQLVELGLLTQDQADTMAGAQPTGFFDGLVTDNDQRVDAWIDADGRVRRLVTTTNLRTSMGTTGSAPTRSETTTTFTTTVEAFDYGQAELALPDEGVTALGSLPAEVLRPLDDRGSPCGQAPTENLRDCAAAAFDDAAAGRSVDELVATIPKTVQALITPNAWFEGCPHGLEPLPAPTDDEIAQMLEIAHIDPARADAFFAATDAEPALADVPRGTRLLQAVVACPALRYAENDLDRVTEQFLPGLVDASGLSTEAYRALLVLLVDPATTICP